MRRSRFSFPFLNISFIATTLTLGCLGTWGGCTDTTGVVDDGTDKRRDQGLPAPRDLAGMDQAPSPDLGVRGDLAMGGPDLAMGGPDLATSPPDLAMAPRDLAMSPADLAMTPRDLAMGPVDLAMAPRDLAMGPVDLAMSIDMTAPADASHVYSCRGLDAPGTEFQVVTDSLTLPTGSGAMAYTYDFDGSGRKKNALKGLVQLVALAGLDLQTPVNTAVNSGLTLQLASLTTTSFLSSSCAGVVVIPAQPAAMPPRFDGTDVFDHFPTTPAELIGTIAAGRVVTKASKDLAATEDGVLDLQLSIGAMSLSLPIHGLHAEGTIDTTGPVARVTGGMLNGVVTAADVDGRVIPGIAIMVTNMINGDPTSTATKLIIGLFENTANPVSAMKCMMPSLCCKTNPATCTILPAEVKMSLVGTALAPDIQAFDAMGKWGPVAGGTSPNGLTVGIGFTAVTATYH